MTDNDPQPCIHGVDTRLYACMDCHRLKMAIRRWGHEMAQQRRGE